MTQSSRPQADNVATFPTSDAGPYSADQWAELFQVLFTGDQEATQGPLANYLNELEPTTVAGDILVDSGAGFCYGHWLVNSASVTFSPTHAAREDRVVLVENNTNLAYSTNLEFPTVLVDYNNTASIEPYSCRLAILTGTGPGAPRPLVNAGGIHMVQIFHYDIDAGGTVTNPTDDRDFCQFSSTIGTRWFLVSVSSGIVYIAGTNIPRAAPQGVTFGAAVSISQGHASFVVPKDYKESMTVRAVITVAAGGSGDVRCQLSTYHAACGEVWNTHTDVTAWAAVTVTQNENECICETAITNVDVNDIVHMTFERDGNDGSDTAGDVYFSGFLVTYEAKS